MRLLAVKSPLIGSRLIQWALNEPASHLAIEFNASRAIYHSYLSGVQAAKPQEFFGTYRVVGSLDFSITTAQEIAVWKEFTTLLPTRPITYDYPALLNFAYHAVKLRLLGIPLPHKADWQQEESFLCTEIVYIFAEAYAKIMGEQILPENVDYAMTSPWQAINLLSERISNASFSHEPMPIR